MALLIPIFESQYAAILRTLNKVASHNWRQTGRIHVLQLRSQDSRANFEIVSEYCQNNRITDILVPPRIHIGENLLREAGYSVHLAPSYKNLVHGDGLTQSLHTL